MGKFTEDFFRFPIKVYHSFSLKKALEEEDKEDAEKPVPIDWIIGYARIPGKDMMNIMWHDGFSRERTVEDVAENGFDLTIISSSVWGEFTCSWPRKKFEEKLDEFVEKWRASLPQVNLPFTYVTGIDPFKDVVTTSSTDLPEGTGKKDA